MKSIIGFLNNANLHAIISTLFKIIYNKSRKFKFCCTRRNLKQCWSAVLISRNHSITRLYYRKRKDSINPQLLALKKKEEKNHRTSHLCARPFQSTKQLLARPFNQVSNFGRAPFNQVGNMGMPKNPPPPSYPRAPSLLSVSTAGPPSPLIPRPAQTHTPPPTLGMVASVYGLWPQCGHLETTQAVTLKSGSSMTLLQFLHLHRHTPHGHNLNYTIWTLYAESVSSQQCHSPLGAPWSTGERTFPSIKQLWARPDQQGRAPFHLSGNFGCALINRGAHFPAILSYLSFSLPTFTCPLSCKKPRTCAQQQRPLDPRIKDPVAVGVRVALKETPLLFEFFSAHLSLSTFLQKA